MYYGISETIISFYRQVAARGITPYQLNVATTWAFEGLAFESANELGNDLTNIPAAACGRCGGWTGHGGMSQHRFSEEKVLGRTGCTCSTNQCFNRAGA